MSSKSGKKKPQDKKPVARKSKAPSGSFGIGIGEVFMAGVKGYLPNALIMTLAGLPVLLVFGFGAQPALELDSNLQEKLISGEIDSISVLDSLQWVGLMMLAALPAGVLAAPWFKYALDIVDKKAINVMAPLIDFQKLLNHAFATFWFWAGIAFGLRYLRGIPSIAVLLLYAFYAYIIADGKEINALKALGISVRMGLGKRIGLFAIAGLFFVFNIFGVVGLGIGLEGGSPTVLGIVLGVLGLSATASVTLISGATIYRVLERDVDE